MSLQEISCSIKNFFESKGPTIYCLSGEWGVGKTYLFNEICNDFLKKNPSNFNNIKLPKDNLIKISLFRVSSVDDLKHKIIAEKLEKKYQVPFFSSSVCKSPSPCGRVEIAKQFRGGGNKEFHKLKCSI